MAAYYVSPAGHDVANGLSPATAWRTLDRANVQYFRAGDQILLEGGKSFTGYLYVSSKEAGRADKPAVISTYGAGRATIYSGGKPGIQVAETAGVAITNLALVGDKSGSTSIDGASGIYIHAGGANRTLASIHIRNVDVRHYGHEGLTITASGAGSSISDVKIERSSFHDNGWGGVNVTGNSIKRSRNYLVDHVKAYNNAGVPTGESGFVTGNGIYLADVEDAVVQRCVVWNNGTRGVAPVGIWAAGATRVTFQHNESYNNRTASSTDGGGFDFDWNVTNSVMQYNYSHGNDGPGYMLGGGPTSNSGNVIRYNVSENDGRKNGKGAIYLWGGVSDASIYNNTVYLTKTSDAGGAALRASDVGAGGKIPQRIDVRNNIFYSAGGAKLINLTGNIAGKSLFTFRGNAYHASGGAFTIQWGGSAYGSLSAWRSAKGQEKTGTAATGFQGDPKLTAAGLAGTIGDADKLHLMTAYRLQKTSPCIDRGVPYPNVASTATLADFFGDVVPPGTRIDIGADEVR